MPDNIRRNKNRGRDAGKAQREQGGHRGAEREGRREGLYVVISTSSPINGDPFEFTAASCGAYVQRRVFFRKKGKPAILCPEMSSVCKHPKPSPCIK